MKSKILSIMLVAIALLFGAGCSEYVEVPAGYVGKILTPTGWEDRIIESGQVDIQNTDVSGRYSVLILLEATTTTVKEQFLDAEATEDKTDHRLLTKSGTPISGDVYFRAMVPEDERVRNSIFAQITPAPTNNPRIKIITVEKIYEHFARMDVRGGVRSIFARYEGWEEINAAYDTINSDISTMALETFRNNGVPLNLQNSQISNMKPDEHIWATQNELATATSKVTAIDQIGQAIRRNPGYVEYMKWEALKEIAKSGSASGTNTIIITEGDAKSEEWASAEYLRQNLKQKP